jgi:hypothetical protein
MRAHPGLSSAAALFLLLGAGLAAAEDRSEPPKLRLELPLSAFDLTIKEPKAPRRDRALPSKKPESQLASIGRGALRWGATIGAFLIAGQLGAHNVDGDANWFFKEPDAREGIDTWRNHATTGPLVGELPSTFRR